MPEVKEEYKGGLSAGMDTEGGIEDPEPWESWETKFVLGSIGIGLTVLAIGGTLANIYLL